MNGGRKTQCSMEGWEEPHCIHMIFPVAEITGAHGIFFFPTERNTETYSILMKGNKQHWLHFQSLENKFRDFASIHACDAEAASCKPEQLWSFTGRATAPPAGSSVHNCLILFFLFIKGEAIKVSRHFLEKQTWLCLLLMRIPQQPSWVKKLSLCLLFNKYTARPYSLTPLVDIFLFALVSNVKTENRKVESLKIVNVFQNLLAFGLSPLLLWWQWTLQVAGTPQVCDSCYPSIISQCSTKVLVMSQNAWLSQSPQWHR